MSPLLYAVPLEMFVSYNNYIIYMPTSRLTLIFIHPHTLVLQPVEHFSFGIYILGPPSVMSPLKSACYLR